MTTFEELGVSREVVAVSYTHLICYDENFKSS